MDHLAKFGGSLVILNKSGGLKDKVAENSGEMSETVLGECRDGAQALPWRHLASAESACRSGALGVPFWHFSVSFLALVV